jgi:hypothetical protein
MASETRIDMVDARPQSSLEQAVSFPKRLLAVTTTCPPRLGGDLVQCSESARASSLDCCSQASPPSTYKRVCLLRHATTLLLIIRLKCSRYDLRLNLVKPVPRISLRRGFTAPQTTANMLATSNSRVLGSSRSSARPAGTFKAAKHARFVQARAASRDQNGSFASSAFAAAAAALLLVSRALSALSACTA